MIYMWVWYGRGGGGEKSAGAISEIGGQPGRKIIILSNSNLGVSNRRGEGGKNHVHPLGNPEDDVMDILWSVLAYYSCLGG